MAFEPLSRIPGVRLVSLQRGPGVEQIECFQKLTNGALMAPTEGRQTTPEDLADTAAIMMNLDLIISVDTAPAHLAGALGRSVWTILSSVADWRWMIDRQDSPWYPTMRLFRQHMDTTTWDKVFENVGEALRERLREKPCAEQRVATTELAREPKAEHVTQACAVHDAQAIRQDTDSKAVQMPCYEVAVVMPTILRPSMTAAVASVFSQRIRGRGQLLLGIDRPLGDRKILEEVRKMVPQNWALMIFDPGYSTSVRYGGVHLGQSGGALRTILSYAAHSRYVAYLDDDNWWAPEHLPSLLEAIREHDWAYSLRWFVDPHTRQSVTVDQWESVGPNAGVYREKFGGFVDPNTLLIDKHACEPVLRWWSTPLAGDVKGMSEDRNVFAALRETYRVRGTNQATCYYVMDPKDKFHLQRLQAQAEGGSTQVVAGEGPEAGNGGRAEEVS
jgi:hypothetical protein